MLIFRQKYFYFCTPRLKTPQPVLPYFVHFFFILDASLLYIWAFYNIILNRNFLFSILLFTFSWNLRKVIRFSLILAIWQKCVVDPRNIDNHDLKSVKKKFVHSLVKQQIIDLPIFFQKLLKKTWQSSEISGSFLITIHLSYAYLCR